VLEFNIKTAGGYYSIAGFLDIYRHSEQNTFQKLDTFPYNNFKKVDKVG
jgi:hypothetical protein